MIIEKKISVLRARLTNIGNMRPGTLSIQYRNPSEKRNPFNQISYTHKGRSRSEYVRPENLEAVRSEIEAYKEFKAAIDQLIDLSIQASRMRCKSRKLTSKTGEAT